jgi:HEAT repeat protein
VNSETAMIRRGILPALLLIMSIAVSFASASGAESQPRHTSAARVAELLSWLDLPQSPANLQRRRDAARQLCKINPLPAEAIASLATALGSLDRAGVQRYARIALAGAGARAIPALAAECGHIGRDGAGCQAAIEGCAARPVLERVLKQDPNGNVRFHAARALSDFGPDCPQTIPALVGAIGDGQVDTATELARLGKPGLAALTPAVQSPDLDVRKEVVEALANLALRRLGWESRMSKWDRSRPIWCGC